VADVCDGVGTNACVGVRVEDGITVGMVVD
jgi:hypothetical protein